MLPLTKQERLVVIALGSILLVGILLQYLLKTHPAIGQWLQFAEQREFGRSLDLNTATLEQLTALPSIGETTAQRIIDYRTRQGRFQNIEELKNIHGIGPSVYERIVPLVRL